MLCKCNFSSIVKCNINASYFFQLFYSMLFILLMLCRKLAHVANVCSMPLDIFCNWTARFVSDLVGNAEDRFSHNEAHIVTDSK